MGNVSLFYWGSVLLALYAAYLLLFCLRVVERDEQFYRKEKKFRKASGPRIVYPLTIAACFVPLLNTLLGAVTVVAGLIQSICDEKDFYFESWLFEIPEKRDEKKEG